MESKEVKIISEQEKKIKKYETKMRDLIEAYKCVVKEKETLEKTVESFSKQKFVAVGGEGSSEIERLQEQVVTISSSLASLNEDKRRMERSFIEDKRVMRNEYEINMKSLRGELDGHSKEVDELRRETEKRKKVIEEMEGRQEELKDQIKALSDECCRLKELIEVMEREKASEKWGHEYRVAQLEETIADISKNIGEMEKQHLSDAEIICKLNDRLQTYFGEFRLSSMRSRESYSDTPDILQFQDVDKSKVESSVETLVERISRLRVQLEHLDPHFDTATLFSTKETHKVCHSSEVCQAKISQLEEELERAELKFETAVMTTSKSAKLSSQHSHEDVQRTNEELLLFMTKSKVTELSERLSNMEDSAIKKDKSIKESIKRMEKSHSDEMARLRQENVRAVSDLQSELTKHRNRTIGLLSEKDREIERLQRIAREGHCEKARDLDNTVTEHNHGVESPELVLPSMFDSSCPLYQCCEIKARMDQELRRLRQQKRQLEVRVRKLEADSEFTKSDLEREIRSLGEKLRRAESSGRLGSTISMEYLRNVFLRYLTTSDSSCRYLMAKAIGKVLEISPREMSCIENKAANLTD